MEIQRSESIAAALDRENISLPRFIKPWVLDKDGTWIEDLMRGGCASGQYMPAVTYCDARQTMNQYADDVMDLVQNVHSGLTIPELLQNADVDSWDGMAVLFVSTAVEAFFSQFDVIDDEEADIEEDIDDVA